MIIGNATPTNRIRQTLSAELPVSEIIQAASGQLQTTQPDEKRLAWPWANSKNEGVA